MLIVEMSHTTNMISQSGLLKCHPTKRPSKLYKLKNKASYVQTNKVNPLDIRHGK